MASRHLNKDNDSESMGYEYAVMIAQLEKAQANMVQAAKAKAEEARRKAEEEQKKEQEEQKKRDAEVAALENKAWRYVLANQCEPSFRSTSLGQCVLDTLQRRKMQTKCSKKVSGRCKWPSRTWRWMMMANPR